MWQKAQSGSGLMLALLIITCISGCSTAHKRTVTPQYATLVNRDVVISAVDADWELTPGARISAGMFQPFMDHPVDLFYAIEADGYKHVADTPFAHEVSIERRTERYVGLLVLLQVRSDAIPAAQARWAIEIPEEFFAGARNGGVSYVRGTYSLPSGGRMADPGSSGTRAERQASTYWILWFSDIRFW